MTVPVGRIPPHDLDAERAVLGSCLIGACFDDVSDILTDQDFYSSAHAHIWGAMVSLVASGSGIDITLVRGRLADAGHKAQVAEEMLLDLTNTIPAIHLVERHARRVQELAQMRRMITVAHGIAATGYSPQEDVQAWLDLAETDVQRAAETGSVSHARAMSAIVGPVVEQVVTMAPGRLVGVPTGITRLDEFTTGPCGGELWIVAGRPGMGKTAFGELMVRSCAMTGAPALWFSLEMPDTQLLRRMLSGEARVNHSRVRAGQLFDEDRHQIKQAGVALAQLPIYIEDKPGVTVMTVRREARRLYRRLGRLGIVVVDYLQLMSAIDDRQPREQQVSQMSKGLKNLARELDVPVVAISQLNRDVEKRPKNDRRPLLSDLRESGSLEQDSDTVLFCYRHEVYSKKPEDEGLAEIIIGKQRNGPTGTVKCTFIKKYARFENLSEQEELPQRDWTGT